MHTSKDFSVVPRLLTTLLIGLWLTALVACGQKGPLTLPASATSTNTTNAASAPAR